MTCKSGSTLIIVSSVVVDAGNGTAGPFAMPLLKSWDQEQSGYLSRTGWQLPLSPT
ncbi:hypothetical protein MASR2M15_29430 [Anaerolineales bacterium]